MATNMVRSPRRQSSADKARIRVMNLLAKRSVAEFFAGIGLMRLGLERQGWRVTFANDIDPQKQATYSGHFGEAEGPFVLGDIHTLSSDSVPDVTLATASFPCTDLSLAGSREGIHGTESSAFWGFTRILEDMNERKPPLILIENVPGFLTSHGGADFKLAMQALNKLGYSVDALVLDAQSFVPQSRQRLFVIGVADGMRFDSAHTANIAKNLESAVRPKSLATYIESHRSDIRWAVRDLPTPPAQSPTSLTDILEDLPSDDPIWWSHPRAEKLLNQMSPKHRKIADAMITQEGWSYGTVFRRMRVDKDSGEKRSMAELRVDGIAGCLRTPKGGSAKQILFKAGYGQYSARLLSPREVARLMGADTYHLPKTLDQAYFGFGDAVCVPVVEWVAKNYIAPLIEEFASAPELRTRPSTVAPIHSA